MSSYDDRSRRYREPRDAHYVEPTHEYYPAHDTQLVPRSTRAEGEMSVEPYYERDIRRSRPSGPYYEEEEYYGSRYADSRDFDRALDRRRTKGSSHFVMAEERSRRRVLSKEQKIMAALAGAALFAGGKELVDRHQAEEEGTAIHRNPLASAALGAAGALAGYQGAEIYNKQASKHKSKHVIKGRNGRIEEDYWTDSSDDDNGKHGSGSFLKNALAAAGVGKMMRSLTGGGDDRSVRSYRSHSTRSRRDRSASSTRSRARSESGAEKMQKAAVASLLAGASEAFRIYKQPGSWKGEKTKRVLTAAATAAGIDAAHDTEHRKLGLLEAVMGGLAGTRALHGSRKEIYEDEMGRSRSRSRVRSRSRSTGGKSGSKVAGPAAAIAGAILGKKLLDRSRSQSRGRRDDSADSYDSRKSKKSLRERSRSAVRKLMGKGDDDRDDDEYYHDYEDNRPRHSHRHRDYDSRSRSRSRSVASYRDRPRGGGGYSSESDLGNSEDEDKEYKKMRGKSLITSGLAAVATIHAAHGVYESYEKRQKRQKAVKQGRLTEAEASRLRKKALLQDAASVGIAALGVKGAISELKEAKELNDQCKEFKHQRNCRHQKRQERRQQKSIDDRWSSDDQQYSPEEDVYYTRPASSSHQLPAPRYG